MERAGGTGDRAVRRVGTVPAFLVLRGLSYKEQPGPIWTSPAGVRVTDGDGGHGAPYGIDRSVFVYLATEAQRQGRSVVGTCHHLAQTFDVSWPRCTTLQRLRRVTASTVEAPRHGPGCKCGCGLMAPKATVAESFKHHRGTDTFSVVLTEAFMVEVQYGAPCSLVAVSRLLSKSAALELYAALVLRAHRGEHDALPLFERGGMCDMIDLADAEFKVRQDIGKRLRLIESVWPEIPYRLELNNLICSADPRAALAAHVGPLNPRTQTGPRHPDHAIALQRQATARSNSTTRPAAPSEPARRSGQPGHRSMEEEMGRRIADAFANMMPRPASVERPSSAPGRSQPAGLELRPRTGPKSR